MVCITNSTIIKTLRSSLSDHPSNQTVFWIWKLTLDAIFLFALVAAALGPGLRKANKRWDLKMINNEIRIRCLHFCTLAILSIAGLMLLVHRYLIDAESMSGGAQEFRAFLAAFGAFFALQLQAPKRRSMDLVLLRKVLLAPSIARSPTSRGLLPVLYTYSSLWRIFGVWYVTSYDDVRAADYEDEVNPLDVLVPNRTYRGSGDWEDFIIRRPTRPTPADWNLLSLPDPTDNSVWQDEDQIETIAVLLLAAKLPNLYKITLFNAVDEPPQTDINQPWGEPNEGLGPRRWTLSQMKLITSLSRNAHAAGVTDELLPAFRNNGLDESTVDAYPLWRWWCLQYPARRVNLLECWCEYGNDIVRRAVRAGPNDLLLVRELLWRQSRSEETVSPYGAV